ncbi:peroxidasin homolog isoform X1 [Acyrthosiphon pisum]|uniref:Ig-like domain-containing protein n=1 Tax=Acyrthosiphon pisum TaxID=7029 RepID=A0A8R2NTS1_ACYPI|nr:peroxidasin homolog isoform X1 [Acyrthosiphon pisum]
MQWQVRCRQCALRLVRAMTLLLHQDAAAAAVLRRTRMMLLLLLLIFSLSSFPSVTAKCPHKCWCEKDKVYCIDQELDRIPTHIPPVTKKLDLSDNKIRDTELKSLAHLTDLQHLDLSYNKIRDIESLAHLTELETLHLSNNNISEVKNGAFANLSKLQALFLHRNKIENIETGAFNNLTSLKELHLYYNNIHKLDLEMFKGLTKLNKLFLSGNKIDNIETGAFNNLTSLEVLHLDYNNIHKLDLEMFKGLTKLNRLFLDHNMIRNIPPGTFDSLTSLSLLQIDQNPLTCDCNILLLVNLLKERSDVLGDYDPSCHFPVEMSEIPLKEITENDFNCTSPDVIVVPENKTVSVGEQLQLSCKAVGDPEPFITWAKDDIDLELGQRVQVFQNNTLIISKVERTDGGKYKCVASNYLGRKSFEAMVNVNGFAENG